MTLAIAVLICAGIFLGIVALRSKRRREQRDCDEHRIAPEALHNLMASGQEVLLFDVRQPLDLLANSEIIPGAKRIPPKEILANPSLVPKDKDSVVYCTCPGDKTSRAVLHQALALDFRRIKFLDGGLAGWKAKGYEVEPYRESFHLDTAK